LNSSLSKSLLQEEYRKLLGTNAVIPESQEYENTQDGMFEAWKLYNNPKAIVLIIHEAKDKNIFDQRAVEFELIKKKVRCVRTIFDKLCEKLIL
jgi:hypothetical protein